MGLSNVVSSVLIGMLSLQGVGCTCSTLWPSVQSDKVATMCQDSVVEGVEVYIDTDLAGTTTLDRGTACTCSVQTQRGKELEVWSRFDGISGSKCGTYVDFTGGPFGHNSMLSTPCYSYLFDVETHTYTNMSVAFRKERAPYTSSYCVQLTLNYCSDNEHQCGDGSCISSSLKCNNFPDCDDESDERSCFSAVCSEGQTLCDDGGTCINADDRCDGVYNCPDQSDESPKYCDPDYTDSGVTGSTDGLAPPLIRVSCVESQFLPPPTTTSTTTTPATTTTTTPSTTTTPTTTTTTPSTTTTVSSTTTTPTETTTTTTTTPTTTTMSSTTTTTTPTETTTTTSTTTTSTSTTTPIETTTTPETTTSSTSTSTTTAPTTTSSTTTPPPKSSTTTPTSTTTSTTTTTSTSTTTSTISSTITPTTTTTTTPTTTSTSTSTSTKQPTTTTEATTTTSTTTEPTTTTQPTTPKPRCNASVQFECGNGSCIPLSWRCDSLEDCNDKSDEAGCSTYVCGPNMFLCDERRTCIKSSERCDGKSQCPDMSDESSKYCGTTTTAPVSSDDGRKTAIIVGCIAGGLLLIAILACIIYWKRTANWNRRPDRYAMRQESEKTLTPDIAYSSPTLHGALPPDSYRSSPRLHAILSPTEKYPPTHIWYPSTGRNGDIPDVYDAEQTDANTGDKRFILLQ